jgi:hypothetical protein
MDINLLFIDLENRIYKQREYRVTPGAFHRELSLAKLI